MYYVLSCYVICTRMYSVSKCAFFRTSEVNTIVAPQNYKMTESKRMVPYSSSSQSSIAAPH